MSTFFFINVFFDAFCGAQLPLVAAPAAVERRRMHFRIICSFLKPKKRLKTGIVCGPIFHYFGENSPKSALCALCRVQILNNRTTPRFRKLKAIQGRTRALRE